MAGMTSKIKLVFAETGSKTINNINPEALDDDVKGAAEIFAELQTREVGAIRRIDETVLLENEVTA